MPLPPPDALQSLASAQDDDARARAWESFLASYSDVLLRVARALGGDHDAAMDRYAFILDALRRDDCHRLRGYLADGRGTFATWLAVVARRLCVDEYRHRYGRPQSTSVVADEQRVARRSLAELLGSELGVDTIEASADEAPDALLLRRELRSALETALARLDTADRLILRMRFEDDLSVPEIARVLDAGSPFRVYRRINRLLALIRTSLKSRGIHESAP